MPMQMPSRGMAPLPTHWPRGWARMVASSSRLTCRTYSPWQGTARAGEEAEALVPFARLY